MGKEVARMLEINNTEVMNFENALRGARNPMNSWARMDSAYDAEGNYVIGEADLNLAKRLCRSGSDHRKFLRQIFVSLDITAPLYWWKEFDTSADYCSIALLSLFLAMAFCSQSLPST